MSRSGGGGGRKSSIGSYSDPQEAATSAAAAVVGGGANASSSSSAELRLYQAFIFSVPIFFTFVFSPCSTCSISADAGLIGPLSQCGPRLLSTPAPPLYHLIITPPPPPRRGLKLVG